MGLFPIKSVDMIQSAVCVFRWGRQPATTCSPDCYSPVGPRDTRHLPPGPGDHGAGRRRDVPPVPPPVKDSRGPGALAALACGLGASQTAAFARSLGRVGLGREPTERSSRSAPFGPRCCLDGSPTGLPSQEVWGLFCPAGSRVGSSICGTLCASSPGLLPACPSRPPPCVPSRCEEELLA